MEVTHRISESKEAGWKGCLMLGLQPGMAAMIKTFAQNNIDEAFLADDGFEEYVHCTVLYGFDQMTWFNSLKRFIDEQSLIKEGINLTLGRVKRFEASKDRPDSDVLVLEAESIHLRMLHQKLKEKFGVFTTYPTYNPHVTLAYVKPGACRHLDGDSVFNGISTLCKDLTYSSGDKEARAQRTLTFEEFASKKTNH